MSRFDFSITHLASCVSQVSFLFHRQLIILDRQKQGAGSIVTNLLFQPTAQPLAPDLSVSPDLLTPHKVGAPLPPSIKSIQSSSLSLCKLHSLHSRWVAFQSSRLRPDIIIHHPKKTIHLALFPHGYIVSSKVHQNGSHSHTTGMRKRRSTDMYRRIQRHRS